MTRNPNQHHIQGSNGQMAGSYSTATPNVSGSSVNVNMSADRAMENIRDILYPSGNPDHEWSPDELEYIAEVVKRWDPKAGTNDDTQTCRNCSREYWYPHEGYDHLCNECDDALGNSSRVLDRYVDGRDAIAEYGGLDISFNESKVLQSLVGAKVYTQRPDGTFTVSGPIEDPEEWVLDAMREGHLGFRILDDRVEVHNMDEVTVNTLRHDESRSPDLSSLFDD